jgi:hypothetical protein
MHIEVLLLVVGDRIPLAVGDVRVVVPEPPEPPDYVLLQVGVGVPLVVGLRSIQN